MAIIVAFTAVFPASAFAQRFGQGLDDGTPAWRVLVALLFCLGVAIAAALVLKRRMNGGGPVFRARSGQRLQMVECLRMGTQANLYIVACDSEELLVSISQEGVSLLRTLQPKPGADQP